MFSPLCLRYFLSLADLFCPCNNRHSISNHRRRSGPRNQPELKDNPAHKSASYSWLTFQSSVAGVSITEEYVS